MVVRSYKSRVVVSGDIVEVYDYSVPILEGYTVKTPSCGRGSSADDGDKLINRDKVLNRARRDLRRLVNTNICDNSKFVTLTFADNVQDFKVANKEYMLFVKRLNYFLKSKVEYICVPEFQKRGAIHFHVVLFNVPYIDSNKLRELWGQGYVKINRIDNVDNVGAYICKYMSKDFDSDDRLKGKKCYFSSRKLNKPVEIKDENLVESVRNSLQADKLVYENEFKNDYNSTHYLQFNMKKTKNKD